MKEVNVQLNDSVIVDALADDAEKFARIYDSYARRITALDNLIREKFPQSEKADRDEISRLVMTEYYRRLTAKMKPCRQEFQVSTDTHGRTIVGGRIPPRHSRKDLAAGAGTEDRRDEIHPPQPQGAA